MKPLRVANSEVRSEGEAPYPGISVLLLPPEAVSLDVRSNIWSAVISCTLRSTSSVAVK